jgi:hypothetical protein
VKVGRAALDEDAIRLIEEFNPQIDFDWTRMLKEDASAEKPAQQRSAERFRPQEASRSARPASEPKASREPIARPSPRVRTDTPLSDAHAPVAADEAIRLPESAEPDVESSAGPELPEGASAQTPAHARLGSEGVSRLRARHAEILTRISERVSDPATHDQLKADAERLNPDTWVTDLEVREGLERYEAVLESLRGAIGQPRRRRRRGARPEGTDGAADAPDAATDVAQLSGESPAESSSPTGDPLSEDERHG